MELIKSPRDITYDGLEAWLGRIVSGKVENVAERSALSTLIAILGRLALYEKRRRPGKRTSPSESRLVGHSSLTVGV